MELGRLAITTEADSYLKDCGVDVDDYIYRYSQNDWGDLTDEDKHSNNMEMFSLHGHVLGSYTLPNGKELWIKTSWSREDRQTIVTFPEDD